MSVLILNKEKYAVVWYLKKVFEELKSREDKNNRNINNCHFVTGHLGLKELQMIILLLDLE